MSQLTDLFGDPIHTYTRTDAIDDGVLVDVSADALTMFGIRWPVAMTAAAHADTVAWGPDQENTGAGQDETGRLADVLLYVRLALPGAIRTAQTQGSARVPFQVLRVPPTGRRPTAALADLVLLLGPGDNGEPVLTVALPTED